MILASGDWKYDKGSKKIKLVFNVFRNNGDDEWKECQNNWKIKQEYTITTGEDEYKLPALHTLGEQKWTLKTYTEDN